MAENQPAATNRKNGWTINIILYTFVNKSSAHKHKHEHVSNIWCEYIFECNQSFRSQNNEDKFNEIYSENKSLIYNALERRRRHIETFSQTHISVVNVKSALTQRFSQNEIETSAKLFKWSHKSRQCKLWIEIYLSGGHQWMSSKQNWISTDTDAKKIKRIERLHLSN